MSGFFRWLIALPVAFLAAGSLLLYIAMQVGELRAGPGAVSESTPTAAAYFTETWDEIRSICGWTPGPKTPDAPRRGEKAVTTPPQPVQTDYDDFPTGPGPHGLIPLRSYYGNAAPPYPRECEGRGAEGEVVVSFDVRPSGGVRNARILSSPDRCFDREVIRTVSGWTYPPAYRNGRAVSRKGVIERFVFANG